MRFRRLCCGLLAALCALVAGRAAQAGPAALGSMKYGASGQPYVWQAGTC